MTGPHAAAGALPVIGPFDLNDPTFWAFIGLLIFIGLTAYDTQRLKAMYYQLTGYGEMMAKMSIMGAVSLYLDFINIFMHLLHFMCDRR